MSLLSPSSSTVVEYYSQSLRQKYLLREKTEAQNLSASSSSADIDWEPNFDNF
jgi:hypothetical protein